MKRVTVIYEGAADQAVAGLKDRTPLQVARAPHAAQLAGQGRAGLLEPVQEGLDERNEMLLATLCGVAAEDAARLQRGPLEAASLGDDSGYVYAYRGNFVTITDDTVTACEVRGLTLNETQSLLDALQERAGRDDWHFRAIGSGRFVMLLDRANGHPRPGVPVGLMQGERRESALTRGAEQDILRELSVHADAVLPGHPVNEVRLDLGENPASGAWLWAGGARIRAPEIRRTRSYRGCMMTQSAMARGLASCLGMDVIELKGYWDLRDATEPVSVRALVEALRKDDFLVCYIEAPGEAGWHGTAADKVRNLERLDRQVLGPITTVLEANRPFRLLLTSDGLVSSADEHPTSGRVPLVLAGEGVDADAVLEWNEEACAGGELGSLKPEQAVELLWGD